MCNHFFLDLDGLVGLREAQRIYLHLEHFILELGATYIDLYHVIFLEFHASCDQAQTVRHLALDFAFQYLADGYGTSCFVKDAHEFVNLYPKGLPKHLS